MRDDIAEGASDTLPHDTDQQVCACRAACGLLKAVDNPRVRHGRGVEISLHMYCRDECVHIGMSV